MIRLFFIIFFVTTSLYGQNIADTMVFDLNSKNIRMPLNWKFQSGDSSEILRYEEVIWKLFDDPIFLNVESLSFFGTDTNKLINY